MEHFQKLDKQPQMDARSLASLASKNGVNGKSVDLPHLHPFTFEARAVTWGNIW